MNRFARRTLDWHRQHGRQDLPWQSDRSPYRVWVSEIMLQQTQVATVIPYFQRFIGRFPTLAALADADTDDVMAHWAGLGYYSRARNLQAAARRCVDEFNGDLPEGFDDLCALPGIGRSTAGAIQALSRNRRHPILDGNVKRVLARFHAVPGWPGKSAVQKKLWALADAHTPETDVAVYTQAIMDLGATVCTPRSPDCPGCPHRNECLGFAAGNPTDYPQRRKKAPLPDRHALLLVATDDAGRLLLQRRPPSGIWGGLWSLPQFEHQTELVDWLGQASGPSAPVIRHTFSHFRLLAVPVKGTPTTESVSDRDDLDWFDPAQAARLGLPKPIRSFVNDLFEDQIEWQDKFTV